MFKFKPSPETDELDETISMLIAQMQTMHVASEEYTRAVDHLSTLSKIKEINTPEKVSRETMALVLGNLLGIGIIVSYEQMHALASRALHFVVKPRLS